MSPEHAPSSPGSRAPGFPFPDDFLFGVATAAHQVEGGNDNCDWWDFEQEPGRIRGGDRSGAACEHYTRFRDDIGLIRDLGLGAYRLSVEWARIEPEPGRFDEEALEHYRQVILACREQGIEPLVTLYHFTLPRWFAQKGGWLAKDASQRFATYADRVSRALSDQVRVWLTINEPMIYLVQGFIKKNWPPAQGGMKELILAGRHLLAGHVEAYKALKARPGFGNVAPLVGVAKHMRVFDPERLDHPLDRLANGTQEHIFNWAWMDSLHKGRFLPPFGVGECLPGPANAQDFFGLNYYTRDRVRFEPKEAGALFGVQSVTPDAPKNDLGWEIYPEGLLRLLRSIHARYGLPIWITENGIADAADTRRASYLAHHLAMVSRAIGEGIPVKAYCQWTLTDNFEWAEGFDARFGLYALDFATQTRTLRPSGALYGAWAKARALPEGVLEKYPL